MARKLFNIKLGEVSLVDSPANPGATVLLYKRADEQKPTQKGIELVCPNCNTALPYMYSNGNSELPNYCPECGASLSLTASGGVMKNKKEKSMAEEFKKESLSPEGKVFVEDLEKRLADSEAKVTETEAKMQELAAVAKKDEPEDVWKGVNPEIKKQFEEMKTRTEESERIAKAERDARELGEFTKRAETELSHLPGELKTKATILKAVSQKLSKEESDEAVKILKAANELIRTGDVFKELGANGGGESGGAWAKIEAQAKDLVSKNMAKSLPDAVDKIMTANPELYSEYLKENPRQKL